MIANNLYIASFIFLFKHFVWFPKVSFSFTLPDGNTLPFSAKNHHHRFVTAVIRNGRTTNTSIFSTYQHDHNNELSVSSSSSAKIQVRLNKVFKATHSRRQADKLIASGRVSVNGEPVDSRGGFYVIPFVDVVSLDGKEIKGWEKMNAIEQKNEESREDGSSRLNGKHRHQQQAQQTQDTSTTAANENMIKSHFEYIKYYKPAGVTCTTDANIRGNIIDSIERNGYKSPHRIYPVGRLDKDTSGLILLTSDGRLPNAVLRGMHKQPKVYNVEADLPIGDGDIQRLRDGIIITTVAQRDNTSKKLTQRTKPCQVERLRGAKTVQMTLMEGRNRQIRKMMGALGFTVMKLHRTKFMNIKLEQRLSRQNQNADDHDNRRQVKDVIRPGDWSFLNDHEMGLVEDALQSSLVDK